MHPESLQSQTTRYPFPSVQLVTQSTILNGVIIVEEEKIRAGWVGRGQETKPPLYCQSATTITPINISLCFTAWMPGTG